jgi:hypothetical protein
MYPSENHTIFFTIFLKANKLAPKMIALRDLGAGNFSKKIYAYKYFAYFIEVCVDGSEQSSPCRYIYGTSACGAFVTDLKEASHEASLFHCLASFDFCSFSWIVADLSDRRVAFRVEPFK